MMSSFYLHPGLVIRKLEQQMGSRNDQQRRAKKEIAAREKALALRDQEESNNVTFLNRGRLTEKQFLAEKKRIERERAAIEAELADWRKAATDFDSRATRLERARLRLSKGRRSGHSRTFEEVRQDFMDLVESVRTYYGKGQSSPRFKVKDSFDEHIERGRREAEVDYADEEAAERMRLARASTGSKWWNRQT